MRSDEGTELYFMHKLGFKIVDKFGEMTRQQKIFFQQGYIYEQKILKETIENQGKYKDVEGYEKSREIIRRKKDGSNGSYPKSN